MSSQHNSMPQPACTQSRRAVAGLQRERWAILPACLLLALATWIMPLAQRSGIDWAVLQALAAQHHENTVEQIADWRTMLEDAGDATPIEQLRAVNNFFNSRIEWRSDPEVWQQQDYWATPLELLGKQAGDCEDFSIAKYISLLELGIPSRQLRITYVRAQRLNTGASIAHMVLAYYPDENAEPLILDNLAVDILPASRRPDLKPVFSFNSAGIWVGGAREPSSRDSTARLSRWRDLLQRMASEGISAH